MIIIKLIGGLGNQMFQYALGRRLAIRNRMQLKLDLSGFEEIKGTTPRHYELNIFPIHVQFATPAETALYTKSPIYRVLPERSVRTIFFVFKLLKTNTSRFASLARRIIQLLGHIIARLPIVGGKALSHTSKRETSASPIPGNRQKYIIERQCEFDSNILQIDHDAYLEGYWQSENYFKDIKDTLLRDFTFKEPMDAKNQQLAKEILGAESVSIHMRRGDYVTLESARKMHGGICNLDYYQQALKIIAKKVPSPHFFVFSDDISWVQRNLQINSPVVYVDHNTGAKSYEDMRLMSLCKHNIIANSSFSWWGAWLNQNAKKVVIAPNRWFNDPTINTKDVVPESWIKIE